MREGYKMTELGEIPEDWGVVISSDVFELIHGYQFRDYDFTDYGLPIVKIGQINRKGEIDMNVCSYFSSNRANEFADKRIFNGDVLMALTGATLGKSCWVAGLENPVYQNYRVGKFVPHDEAILSKQFLYFLIGSPIALEQIMSKINSGAQGNVGKSDFEKLKIPLPPLIEQQKIAEILSTVDDKIDVIDQKISETQELKIGLMQRLLTKGIGHTEFKDSPLGEIPKSWEVVKIEDIADVKGGKRLPKGETLIEEETNHPYIRVSDMYMGGVDTSKILYVPEHVFPIIERYIIRKDDLFISVAGTLGIVGQIPIELDGANLTENADKLTNIKMNKSFLLQVLLSPIVQDAVQREQTNNAQPKLALTRIKTFEVPKPTKVEQEKIASILSNIDEKLKVLEVKKTHYQELKQGLMQQLLTGKIRVNGLINKPTMA